MKRGVFLLVLFIICLQSNQVKAQGTSVREIGPLMIEEVAPIICYSRDENMQTYVPLRKNLEAMAAARSAEAESAVFEVNYTGFSTEEQTAFQYAVNIWSALLNSDVPIRIDVAMRSDMPIGTLASTGWGSLNGNFKNAQKMNTYYVVAMAERMAGEELNDPTAADIFMSFNAARNFYTGLDGQPPINTFDLVSIALHEIAHGLGFYTHTFVDDNGLGYFGAGFGGVPTVYARAIENSIQENIFDSYDSPSEPLGEQLTGDDLFFRGESFVTASRPRLYAPSDWNSGSSIAHLDEATYPAGNQNSLMTPQIGFAEAIHEPGISLIMLQDMGWVNIDFDYDALLDTENANLARAVTAVITGDNEVVQNSVQLTYTFANWSTGVTVAMTPTGNPDEYEAIIPAPGSDAIVSYYLAADDIAGRQYSSPGEAPDFYNQYIVAADTIDPVLEHHPLSVALTSNLMVDVVAFVRDNLGAGPLIMTYRIAGKVTETEIEIPPLEIDRDEYYSAVHFLEWDLGALNVEKGDVVEYKLRVVDASGNANEAIHPSADIGYNRILIDQINAPEPFYTSDFNSVNDDFVGFGFTIGNEAGFSSGILHSNHPYRLTPGSSVQDTLVLYQMLKTPIIVSPTNSKITFDEVVLVEPGEPGSSFGENDFWDYVIVEASRDYGQTWVPLDDGYDSKYYSVWEDHYNSDLVVQEFNGSQFLNSEALGNETLWRLREISILENTSIQPGEEVLLRFKLYADRQATGWGWAIDNLKIQLDDEAPDITHMPTDYLFPGDEQFEILAKVTDNGILDSVSFEVVVNGNTQVIGLDEETDLYPLTLNLDAVTTQTEIKYRIIAVDSAVIPNTAFLPELGFFRIPVAELGPPKAVYSNDFNSTTDDFVGANYRVREYDGFNNPAIHSVHPHPNAPLEVDTMSYLLKYPILTNADHAWMSFDEVVLVNYNGDGVLIEVSKDNGANWYPVISPYSVTEHTEWLPEFFKRDIAGNSIGLGSDQLYRQRLVDLLSPAEINGGDEVLVRFSLIADDNLYAWGWAIDNLEIQDVTTGIERASLANFELYPNPALEGKFSLKSSVDEPRVTLLIRDMAGKALLREEIFARGGFDRQYDLSSVGPGIYLVSLQSSRGRSVKRLIIK